MLRADMKNGHSQSAGRKRKLKSCQSPQAEAGHDKRGGVSPDEVVALGKRKGRAWKHGHAPNLGRHPKRSVSTVPPPRRLGMNVRPEMGQWACLLSRMTRRKSQ